MGLDQSLYRKTYINRWDPNEATSQAGQGVTILIAKQKQIGHINPKKVLYIEEEVIDWRKSNQIHKWFVDNVQGGNDDCGTYSVSRDQIKDLMDACKAVVDDPDRGPELLPTQGGFFFGETDYDGYYLDDVKSTYDDLKKVLEETPDHHSIEFFYNSSW